MTLSMYQSLAWQGLFTVLRASHSSVNSHYLIPFSQKSREDDGFLYPFYR